MSSLNCTMEITTKYQIQGRVLNKAKYSRPKYPILPAIIKIPNSEISSFPLAEEFLIDSGASISIIHQRRKDIFEDIMPVDTTTIVFGNSKEKMNVFNIILRIKGQDYNIVAALATKLNFKYSILGYYKGIENFDYFIMNNRKEIAKLVNKI